MAPTTNKVYSKAISILDTPTFHSLVGNANTESGFVDATLYLIDILHTFRAPSRMCEPSTAFYNFLAWCGQDANTALLTVDLQSAIHTRRSKARSQISQKQWLVYTIGLDWKSDKQMARRDLLISLMKETNLVIAPHRNTPYPPVGQWVAESDSIRKRWRASLSPGSKRHDKRTPTYPIHLLDYSQLHKDIGPCQDAYIIDENFNLVGYVKRNACKDGSVIKWVDGVAEDITIHRKSVRLDDPGTLAISGFSAGSRSCPSFGWARNVLPATFSDKAKMQETLEELDKDTCAAFALFWNLCRSWVPAEIIDDIDTFTIGAGLPPMDPKIQDTHTGNYNITLGTHTLTFANARLAPAMGLAANNYARYIHRDNSPHEWAISLTTERNCDDTNGGAFYFAEHGVRVAGAPNTIIAWRQTQYHGTSLQNLDPKDSKPLFSQRGLAIVTSPRLLNTYQHWKDGQISLAKAREEIVSTDSEDDIIC